MAYVLHGDGLCSSGHHGHSHGHSHINNHRHLKPSNDNFHNNNRSPATIDLRHKILQNINNEDGLSQSLLLNTRNRSNSTCSYRSPSHSRTNSFSRTLPFNGIVPNGGISGGSTTGTAFDPARRSSHSLHNNSNSSKLKNFVGAAHRDSIDSDMTR